MPSLHANRRRNHAKAVVSLISMTWRLLKPMAERSSKKKRPNGRGDVVGGRKNHSNKQGVHCFFEEGGERVEKLCMFFAYKGSVNLSMKLGGCSV